MAVKQVNVAVDNGYADQKIAYWGMENDERVIKTLLIPSRAQIGAVNINMDGQSEGVYSIDGMDYTVSELWELFFKRDLKGTKYVA